VPGPSIDWTARDPSDVPIEERDGAEVREATGGGKRISLLSPDTPVANPAFDVTPARLVTGLVTERGVCAASPEGLRDLYPERAAADPRVASSRDRA
jgi:methylthioribose-1-phosphate isomerase